MWKPETPPSPPADAEKLLVNVEGQITAENSTPELRVGESKDTSFKIYGRE